MDVTMMDYKTATEVETKNRKNQKATKYTDDDISSHIVRAASVPTEFAVVEGLVAIAKILYNLMIDERWR